VLAHVLDLSRPLTHTKPGKSKEIVGEGGVSSSRVGRGSINKELAIHVQSTEFGQSAGAGCHRRTSANDSRQPLVIVSDHWRELAYLRQFALTVVSES